jgi:hypothetical protein
MANELTTLNDRLPDLGPRYVETPLPDAPPQPIAEPWNAASALLFVIIAVYWLIRLRGRYRQFPFLSMCLPLLLVGGVGGTLFHALRTSPTFFLMDVIPIYLLGLVITIYLWLSLRPNILYLLAMIVFLGFLQLVGNWNLPSHWAINLSYAELALLVILPLAIVLVRTSFRSMGWVTSALVCFGIAWFCRISDTWYPPLLPMGTHSSSPNTSTGWNRFRERNGGTQPAAQRPPVRLTSSGLTLSHG